MPGDKVLFLNYKDLQGGGASFAGYSIFRSLKNHSRYTPYMLCGEKHTEEPKIEALPLLADIKAPWKYVRKFEQRVSNRIFGTEYWSARGEYVFRHEFYKNCDVVNLHNLHGGNYFSYTALDKIGKEKPIVVTMQDMWYLTGHCAYSFDCLGYKKNCKPCNYLDYYPALNYDLAGFHLKNKLAIYKKHKIAFISCSKWFAGVTKESFDRAGLDNEVIHINNPIQTELLNILSPENKAQLRVAANIPAGAKVMCFGVANINDPRKGLHAFLKHLSREFVKDNNLFLLLMGRDTDFDFSIIPDFLNYKSLGNKMELTERNLVYNMSDVFVLPTLADDLPNVILESMCVGLPVVCFDSGGCDEAVVSGKTGYLAKYGNYPDFMKGIEAILSLVNNAAAEMSLSCRSLILRNFSEEYSSSEYEKVFDRVRR
jgi:glycosyltransferase involved in cell wall biosynthesis